jgi:hypothetical protein
MRVIFRTTHFLGSDSDLQREDVVAVQRMTDKFFGLASLEIDQRSMPNWKQATKRRAKI